MSADLKRNAKIDKFKRDRAAKARINVRPTVPLFFSFFFFASFSHCTLSQEIQRMMYIARKDGEVDQEKELRELYVTQIQCYAREAIDDLDMLQQVMLSITFRRKVKCLLDFFNERMFCRKWQCCDSTRSSSVTKRVAVIMRVPRGALRTAD